MVNALFTIEVTHKNIKSSRSEMPTGSQYKVGYGRSVCITV